MHSTDSVLSRTLLFLDSLIVELLLLGLHFSLVLIFCRVIAAAVDVIRWLVSLTQLGELGLLFLLALLAFRLLQLTIEST